MAKYISFGQFDKKYFFILGSITVRIIMTFIIGFTPSLTPRKTLYLFGFSSYFFSHPIITQCFQFFSLCLGGLILELIFPDKNNKKNKSSHFTLEAQSPFLNVRGRSLETPYIDNKKYSLRIFYIFTLFYFGRTIITSLDNLGYNRVKIWTLEFIFLYYFSKKILKRSMYRHQKLSLIAHLFFCGTIYIIISFIPQSSKDCSFLSGEDLKECEILNMNSYSDINHKLGWYFIPIFIIMYIAAMLSSAYSSIITKWFMDIKYININRILIYIGIIGLFYSLILLFIFSKISCSKDNDNISYICKIDYQGNLFYDTYKTLGNIEINSNFYIDIFALVPIYIVSSFLFIFFELLIIKDLDPFYIIAIDSIYFLIYETIDYSINYPIATLNRNIKFACQESSNIISIFLFSIYLEIIELHFCKLDLSLKRNIIERVKEENSGVITALHEISDSESVESSDTVSYGLSKVI